MTTKVIRKKAVFVAIGLLLSLSFSLLLTHHAAAFRLGDTLKQTTSTLRDVTNEVKHTPRKLLLPRSNAPTRHSPQPVQPPSSSATQASPSRGAATTGTPTSSNTQSLAKKATQPKLEQSNSELELDLYSIYFTGADKIDKNTLLSADVLGAQYIKADNDSVLLRASPQGWKLLGLVWYWWALMILAIGGLAKIWWMKALPSRSLG